MSETREDRISNLPGPLLHHIHSFLEIKDGARTSVLSKRWNHIRTTVPILEFQFENQDSFYTSSESEQFMDFVGGTLDRRTSSLDKVRIQWRDWQLSKSRLRSWMSTLVRANVKELSLYLYQNDSTFVPHPLSLDIFTCQSLTSLELGTHPNVRLPEHISLPRLKRLKLFEYDINNECWNEELFTNSTVLEELFLHRCIYRKRSFYISIPTLKLLKIVTAPNKEDGLKDCVLNINAPKLVTLAYWGSIAKEFVLSSFPALIEASVFFKENDSAEAIIQLLCALARVKRLTMNDKALQVICSAPCLLNNMLTFHNVKILSISDFVTTDQGLISLLKAVPNLEALRFEEFMNDEAREHGVDDAEDDVDDYTEDDIEDPVVCENNHTNEDKGDVTNAAECGSNDDCKENCGNEDGSWAPDIVITECLFPHLKAVCFEKLAGNPREMKWVRLILRYAKALQIMTIHGGSEKQVMVEVTCFPRASPDCMINFC